MSEQADFGNVWRKNHEIGMALSWYSAAIITFGTTVGLPVPKQFGAILVALNMIAGTYRLKQAHKINAEVRRIKSTDKEFINIDELIEITKKASNNNQLALGRGFLWTDIESSKMHQLLWKGIAAQHGKKFVDTEGGAYWLHGLAQEKEIFTALDNLVGHTLVTGTTRVGKTRMFDLLIGQAIARGEVVIIVDPKGDHGLADNAMKMCAALGDANRFEYFNPAQPENSVCIDPMRNWNRKTELASRVAALIPSETGADPFTAFSWKVLNDIINGFIMIEKRPTLVDLKHFVEGGVDSLLLNVLRTHFQHTVLEWETRISGFIKHNKNNLLQAYANFYKGIVIHEQQSVEIDGLLSSYEHNREHFQKMVASLIPILSMLTAAPLAELLSPDTKQISSKKVTDMARIIRGKKVLYVGLDALSDSTVGSAIGSIILADLAAVAGDRYNYGLEGNVTPVNIFIDEAAEVLNQPSIQLMNKGGGALFRVTIATQTFADFTVRLGDPNKARQVLANTNNKITFRVLDTETQEYIAEGIPKIKVKSMSVQYGHNVDGNIQDEYTATYKESSSDEEADLIPPAILGELPPLHFFARMSGGRTLNGRIPILGIPRLEKNNS
jgi:conjugal transfer pilus assembly protein TraD